MCTCSALPNGDAVQTMQIYSKIIAMLSQLTDEQASDMYEKLKDEIKTESQLIKTAGNRDRYGYDDRRTLQQVYDSEMRASNGSFDEFSAQLIRNYRLLRLAFRPGLHKDDSDTCHPPVHPYFATRVALKIVELLKDTASSHESSENLLVFVSTIY